MKGRNRTTATLVEFALLIALATTGSAAHAKYQPIVVVSDPYIELHTGPGRGYPIFYVAAQGDQITILREQTDWYKVRTPRHKEGWVHVSQMNSTLDLDGRPIKFPQYGMDDFMQRRWQFGLGGGDFDGARVINATLSFSLTPNIRTDFVASQLLGDYSDGVMGTASIVMVPFPEWRLSPFFGIGTGVIHIEPQTTIVQSKDRTDEIAHVAAGFDFFVSQRFTLNVAYKRHTVFTSQDENKEIDEWTAGFSFFL